ncbi:unnamed protein product [Alternaria alternata]
MVYRVRRSRNPPLRTSKARHPKPFALREYNDISFQASRQGIENERDFVDSFLEYSESLAPCWSTRVIRNFCQKATQAFAVRPQADIYIDDRERSTNRSRDHPATLTAESLHRHLEVKRFGVAGIPDADYRQIRIHNLDRESLLALARTSECHQADTLRDVFAQHIQCKTSFRVHESVDGFVTPRLELHLPYSILREVSSASDEWKNRNTAQEGESWLDLPLPDTEINTASRSDRFLIEKAHISIVLCVWDYSKWVGYFFSKGDPTCKLDPEPEEKESDADNDDEEDCDTEDDGPIPKEDIFAPRDVDHGLYADEPIRDPREYFLRIVDVWIIFVLRKYTFLVRMLDACVESWQKEIRCAFTEMSYDEPQKNFTRLFNNIVKIAALLRHIKAQVSLTTRAWRDFNRFDGDINCFKDIRDTRGRRYLKSINTSFRELSNHESNLGALIATCVISGKNFKLRMELESRCLNFESNRLNHQSNRLNLESIELQRQVRIANKENLDLQRQVHAANLESIKVQHQTLSVNLTTQRISRDMQRMNQQNTLAAQRTSYTTRTNVLMIWITTPFLAALQYFSADQPIFTSFDRSPRNFGISLCILALALPLLTWTFNILYGIFDSLIAQLFVKKTRNEADPEDDTVSENMPTVITSA